MPDRPHIIEIFKLRAGLVGFGDPQVVKLADLGAPVPLAVAATGPMTDMPALSRHAVTGARADLRVDVTERESIAIALRVPLYVTAFEGDDGAYLRLHDSEGVECDLAMMVDEVANALSGGVNGADPRLCGKINAITDDLQSYALAHTVLSFTVTPHDIEDLARGPATGFVAGTMILTRRGQVAVEDLSPADHILTVDHGFQQVDQITSRCYTPRDIAQSRGLRPVRILAGALGGDLPATDLYVAQGHRCLIRSNITELVTGRREGLAAAGQLVGVEGIDLIEDGRGVVFYQLAMAEEELIFANGTLTEIGNQPAKPQMQAGDHAGRSAPRAGLNLVRMSARPRVRGDAMRSIAVLSELNSKTLIEPRTYSAPLQAGDSLARLNREDHTVTRQPSRSNFRAN
jgi:hypothetical protein